MREAISQLRAIWGEFHEPRAAIAGRAPIVGRPVDVARPPAGLETELLSRVRRLLSNAGRKQRARSNSGCTQSKCSAVIGRAQSEASRFDDLCRLPKRLDGIRLRPSMPLI